MKGTTYVRPPVSSNSTTARHTVRRVLPAIIAPAPTIA
eukprot:CAMPEP_0172927434 /NCGR_PEP_ID=MMETSP1075-20121228/217459_1 /TAXON_ID=2916 /ORGANISM="Ceratium fusus, Strain PA161109" /LENGTH=37 /DNA_ID= /DNA_START= /DNA_END= /DNA_ORIENTATION=